MQYNGEYAKEGEEWPPAEAFSHVPEEERPSTERLQQAGGGSRPSLSHPAGSVRQTQSAQEVAALMPPLTHLFCVLPPVSLNALSTSAGMLSSVGLLPGKPLWTSHCHEMLTAYDSGGPCR